MGALRDRRFRRLLIGNAISSFGDSALYLSLGIWVKDLTGSNAAAGAVYLAQGLAYLAAPLAGQLVDRFPRRRILILANAAAGVAVLALVAVHSSGQLWIVYVVAFSYGGAFTILGPAGAGLVKDLLPDGDLIGANSANTTIGQGLRVVSPLVGAAIYARLGGDWLAVLDTATFAMAIVSIVSVRVTEIAPSRHDRRSPGVELLAGAAHLRSTALLAQITAVAVAAMLVMGFYESVTFAVITAIGKPASFFGVLMAIQAVGSIVGGLAASRLIRYLGEARTLGAALVIWVVASLIYTVRALPAACVALLVFGIAVPLYAVVVATATQRHTPPHLQGRTAAASNMATNLAQTISITIGAALVDRVGYRSLLVVVAFVVAGAAVPVLFRPAQPPLPAVVAPPPA